jgi:SAM-dependent methyltransferase
MAENFNQALKQPSASCVLCSSEDVFPRAAMRTGHRVWQCRRCSLYWVDRDDLLRIGSPPTYDDYSYNASSWKHFEERKSLYLRGLRKRIRRSLPGRRLEEASFLDVGCANGEYLWAACALGFGAVAGVEIDPTAAAVAGRFGRVVASLDALDRDSFDVVQIKNVIGNIAGFWEFMRAALRVLKPGGTVFVDVPNQAAWSARLKMAFYGKFRRPQTFGHLRPPYVVNGFTPKSLRILLSDSGLELQRLGTAAPGTPQLPYYAPVATRTFGGMAMLFQSGPMLISESTRRS